MKKIQIEEAAYKKLIMKAMKSTERGIRLDSKEKSIIGLLDRMKELEADLRYETKLNEQIRSENERLKSFIENKLKINH